MVATLSYMGTKRELAPRIASEIASTRDGALLDLFAGMAAVGRAVGPKRHLWLNDIQLFACRVNKVAFKSRTSARVTKTALATIRRNFEANSNILERMLSSSLECERVAFANPSLVSLECLNQSQIQQCSFLGTQERLSAREGHVSPYRLFAYSYAGGFFSLKQAIELDSLRFGIDEALESRTISEDTADRMLASLCRAAMSCASSTGHFAQFLTPKPNTLARYVRTRNKSIWDNWIRNLPDFSPVGQADWRKGNRVYNESAGDLLASFRNAKKKPGVIYADPPYTSDQYSRYYHLLETLILYDYPETTGKGQYRPNRFSSPFCSKKQVVSAFSDLVSSSASLDAALVVSYPTNGLLDEMGVSLFDVLRQSYATVRDPIIIDHRHSSFGASKGKEKLDVVERIFIAEPE